MSHVLRRWRNVTLAAMLVAVTVVQIAPSAQAVEFTETHTSSIPAATTNWTIPVSVPQFDPSQGDLLDVTISMGAEVASSMSVENLSTSSVCNATLTWGATISADTGLGTVAITPVDSQTILLEVYDGVTDFAGPSGESFSNLDAARTGDFVFTDPAVLAVFTGTGSLSLPINARALTTVTGCGTIAQLITTLASADITVAYRYDASPAIDIEKATNGEDADAPTGPEIPVGDPVTWTYVVTNTGNVALSDVTVVDDQGVAVTCPQDTLAVAESMTCTGNGTAEVGQYANLGTTAGEAADGTIVTDEDPSHYYGVDEPPPSEPAIDIEKATNGEDADEPTGPWIVAGDPVEWTYVVTNTGDVDLSNVTVVDDQGVAVTCPQDTLAVGESMTCTANGTAEEGQYANLGTTEGEAADGTIVTDEDPSHYYGASRTCAAGCTSNYYGNPLHFGQWRSYGPDDAYGLVFGVDVDGSLVDMIRAPLDPSNAWAALGREAVTALLNAAHPDVPYPYTEAEIIAQVRNAYQMNEPTLARGVLKQMNQRACPLGPGNHDH